jgi:uncharacterized Zn finger protein (UPF0148 family)
VYRRLLNGWLLTNSICPQCLAPLMQSTTGVVECVVCSSTESSEPSPLRGFTDRTFSDQDSNLLTKGENQGDERASASYLRTAIEPVDPEATSHGNQLMHSSGNGLRYLAIPENLDMDDHEALLSFLAESKRQKSDTALQDMTNNHQASLHSAGITRESRDVQLRSADSEPTLANSSIAKMTNSTNISIPHSQRSEIALSKPPASLHLFESYSKFEKGSRRSSMISHDELRLVKSDSHRENATTNSFNSLSVDVEPHHNTFRDRGISVPLRGDEFSYDGSKLASQSFPIGVSNTSRPSQGTTGRTYPSYANRGSRESGDSDLYQGDDLITGNRYDIATRSTGNRLSSQSFGRCPSGSREIVLKEQSPSSETGAVFAEFPDDNDLILVFESSKSYPSDELTRRSPSLSPSPRRPRRPVTREDPSYRFHSGSQTSPDYIVHHSIKSQYASMESRCHACSKPLRTGAAVDIVCENPRCTVYMIPAESIDIFTSTMKEDTEDARSSERINDMSNTSISRGYSNDMMRWNVQGGSERFSQRGDSDKYSRHGKASPFVSFSEDIESRVSSVDSFKSVTSDTVNALLSRMSDTRKLLVSNGIVAKNQEANPDMALLINRLASAAVAIKDLEQSVYEAEESSPQRSFLGRPPTSPRTRSPFRGSDKDIRWF